MEMSQLPKKLLDKETFIQVMEGGGLFHALFHAVMAAKAYEEGLDSALSLLASAERFRPELDDGFYHQSVAYLYNVILRLLDRLDRWETYLAVCDQIEKNVTERRQYIEMARRPLIERKLAKLRDGKVPKGNWHGQGENLTPEQRRERFDRCLAYELHELAKYRYYQALGRRDRQRREEREREIFSTPQGWAAEIRLAARVFGDPDGSMERRAREILEKELTPDGK